MIKRYGRAWVGICLLLPWALAVPASGLGPDKENGPAAGLAEPSPAAGLDAAAIADRLFTDFYGSFDEAELAAWSEVIRSARREQPEEARWVAADIALRLHKREFDDAKALADSAYKQFERSAEVQYWYGEAQFRTMGPGTGMLEAKGAMDKALPAYRRAIRYDPAHVPARVGLAMFHLNAPWIAGGRMKEAKNLAQQLVGLDGGEPWGRMVLFMWANEEDRKHLDRYYRDAMKALQPEMARPVAMQYAIGLIEEDPSDARIRGVMAELAAISAPDDQIEPYVRGRWHHAADRHAQAAEAFRLVLDRQPNARQSRMLLAESLEALGRDREAAEVYSEFAERFPDDDRAKEARKKARKLG